MRSTQQRTNNTSSNKITIQCLGAAGTVTGSKHLVKTNDTTILIDCGMFQGLKSLRKLNWESLPTDVSSIDLVLLTHGHLDHTGYLPKLVEDGYTGSIWGTAPTLDIARIILEDSARVQEEDAERANKEKFSKHEPALPLYDSDDVKKTTPHFHPQPLNKWIKINDTIKCRFRYNAHIIGAAYIELKVAEKLIVFSGDIGRENDALMFAPTKPAEADVLFIESTYGDRLHADNTEEELIRIINHAAEKKGSIIIPSFAVERTQTLMYLLWQLRKNKKIQPLPIFMDSPMGLHILGVFYNYPEWHKLSAEECQEMCKEVQLIRTMTETYQTIDNKQPKIVIAGSGMATGGRVLTYLQHYLGDTSATIMLAGYQAEGTRGRSLLDGAKEIKLFGKYYAVRATIEDIKGLSAHADQHELIDWMSNLKKQPEHIFIVHGEPKASEALKEKIKEVYGWDAEIPVHEQEMVV